MITKIKFYEDYKNKTVDNDNLAHYSDAKKCYR